MEQAPQYGDDHVSRPHIKIEIKVGEPTTISTDEILDAVAYAVKELYAGFGIYVDDSETCETDSNVYFKSLFAQWERVDFCLGEADGRHLHVTAHVGYTMNWRAIKAEARLVEVSG